MTITVQFVERIRHVLLAAGLDGMTKQQLMQKVRSKSHNAAEINEVLKAWRQRKWIDDFRDTQTRLPRHVIRATQLLFTEWPEYRASMDALLLNGAVRLGRGPSQTRTGDPEEASPEPASGSSGRPPPA